MANGRLAQNVQKPIDEICCVDVNRESARIGKSTPEQVQLLRYQSLNSENRTVNPGVWAASAKRP